MYFLRVSDISRN